MAKVTCKCCSEKIDKKIAIGVPHGKTTWYYCPEHVGQKSPKEKMYDLIYEIFGRKVLNTVLYKEMDEIASIHTYEKMTTYMEENKEYLIQIMEKDFRSEYFQIRYLSAVLKNSLFDYQVKEPTPVIQKASELEFDMTEINYKAKKQRKGMDDLLDEIL